MFARAIARYIRISPKKARLVVDTVRGKKVGDALAILLNINKKSSEILSEIIAAAANNAVRKNPEKKFTHEDFYISKIVADEGPALTRYRAASMGRATMIKKRTSHILVEVDLIPGKQEEKSTVKSKRLSKPKTLLAKKGA